MQFAQHADPDLDVAPLGAPNLTLRADRQMRQIAILDADQVRLTSAKSRWNSISPFRAAAGSGHR